MKRITFWTFYLACSLGAWATTVGAITCYYPNDRSAPLAVTLSALGPFGLVIASAFEGLSDLSEGRGYHFRIQPLTSEQRWNAFHREYPSLSRYYFDHGHEQEDEHCKCYDDSPVRSSASGGGR